MNMLDLIEYRLHKGQVGCRKLSGHLSVDKRAEVSSFEISHGPSDVCWGVIFKKLYDMGAALCSMYFCALTRYGNA